MTFSTKLAKLGKAELVNCNQISADPVVFNVYLSNKKIEQKTLDFANNNYSLSKTANNFGYTEIIGINSQFVLARQGNYFSILKVANGS